MFSYIKKILFQQNKDNISVAEMFSLAIENHNNGNLEQAQNLCSQILDLHPGHSDSLHLLGVIISQKGNYEKAIRLISQAIEANQDVPEYYMDLGRLLLEQQRQNEAIVALEKVLQLKPDFYDALKLLGITYKNLWLLEDAKETFINALELRDDDAELHDYLGLMLHLTKDFDGAKTSFENAIQINPDYLPAYNNLAALLQAQGNFDEAELNYAKAIQISPDNPQSIAGIAQLKKFTPKDMEFIDNAESVLNSLEVNDKHLRLLHFSLGKMLDDCGEYDRAFSHYEKANTVNCREYVLDPDTEEQKVSAMINTFTPGFFEQCKNFGDTSRLPVFIVGMPRSGTSLVEQIISSHPAVYGAGELVQIGNLAKSLHEYLDTEEQYPECILQLDKETAHSLANEYLAHLQNLSGNASRITDKMPANFVHLGLISILFPGSFIIHCRRDPLDICLSMYFNNMAGPPGYATRLSDIGYWYKQYERLMDHWIQFLPVHILEIHYEQLIGEQEATSRQLIEYLELDWDNQCIDFHKTSRTVLTASNWQVKQPIYKSSLYRWKNYEKYLGPLKEIIEYDK